MLRRRPAMLVLVACAIVAVSCGGSTTSSNTVPFTITDLVVGTGTEATNGATLTVNYTGWLYDPSKPDNKGLQFETSIGSTPFTFVLGTASVIAGWDAGLVGMKVGGTRRLIVPPSMGYLDVRYGVIPPYATLVFDIDLLDVQTGS